jgi:acyl-CoA thioester hydrolase
VTVTPGLAIYRTQILPDWIDFNGHLRDAYYVLVVSYAMDALMDHLGMDAAYRQRTHCTLYSVELHVHYLHEVKESDLLEVTVRIIAADEKRIHAEFFLGCARHSESAATVEVMLLHVRQAESVAAVAFPTEIAGAIATLKSATANVASGRRGSRKMELRGR